ncbi:MAG TPA: DUF4142 domain-containing protein [Bryobacteraceae bacterium]|jgi:putative membrane protein|nr:DUF4142 domain-containing protein [Bryobacteraceae bacterium]
MQNRSIVLGSALLTLFAVTIPAYSAMSSADKQFMMNAARTDMIEAHEGQLAADRATQSDVKDLAKTLVTDHTQDYEQLSVLAAKTGVKIPKGINAAKDPAIAQLNHLKGAGFDRQFTRDEIADHRREVAVFKRESEHGKDPDVKAYATQTLPTLQKHLQLAEQCEKPAKKS